MLNRLFVELFQGNTIMMRTCKIAVLAIVTVLLLKSGHINAMRRIIPCLCNKRLPPAAMPLGFHPIDKPPYKGLSLDISWNPYQTIKNIEEFIIHNPNSIEEIDISGFTLNTHTIRRLLFHQKTIKKLTANASPTPTTSNPVFEISPQNPRAMLSLILGLPTLEELHISHRNINFEIMLAISNHAKLKKLHLELTPKTLEHDFLLHVNQMPPLETLSICCIQNDPHLSELIYHMLFMLPHIEILQLNLWENRFDEIFEAYGERPNFSNLKSLNLSQSRLLTDNNLAYLCLPNLEYLNIVGCRTLTPACLLWIKSLPELKEITVSMYTELGRQTQKEFYNTHVRVINSPVS